MRLSVPPRLAFAAIALVSLALLVARSRPLARFAGGIEPLLYASGLTEPRALVSLPDGTILAAEPARVVEVGIGGQLTAVEPARLPEAALAYRSGLWAVALVPDGTAFATLPDSGAAIQLHEESGRIVERGRVSFASAGAPQPRPTGVATAPDGSVYVALFATVPNRAGSGQVVKMGPDGQWSPAFEGLSFPVALGFDLPGRLYVLELAERYDERTQRFAPRSGRLVALGPAAHQRRTLIREIDLPSSLVFTPAGDLYFTERAVDTGPGEARLLRVPAQGMQQ